MEEFHAANPKGNKDFEDRLAPIKSGDHLNRSHYIYKTIILHNLYGVDLMKEAVEIAKLRLFLKLVAEVDPSRRKKNYGLEPLPDIDFNIRSGNTLVGFATEQQLEDVVQNTEGELSYKEKLEELKSACRTVALYYDHFQKAQITSGSNSDKYKEIKKSLRDKLKELDEKLNRYLADTYGLGTKTQWKSKKEKEEKYQEWKFSHQPFHWLAEFYDIICKGGFDVVIGNPPYVEVRNIEYEIRNYETISCGDVYALIVERANSLLNKYCRLGMIVPISIISTDGFNPLKNLLNKKMGNIWYSSYSMRPAKLFEGVEKRLTIFLTSRSTHNKIYSTKYHVWSTECRESLFHLIDYADIDDALLQNDSIPKISTSVEISILKKIQSNLPMSKSIIQTSGFIVYHTRKLRYFVQFLDTPPKIYDSEGKLRATSELKKLYFKDESSQLVANAIYLSTLFFWFYICLSDCRNLNKREVFAFPIDLESISQEYKKEIAKSSKNLLKNLQENSYLQEMNFKQYGTMQIQNFQPRLSKPIVDDIDKILAKHYGFTEEELDFIINYDIKYRMGGELEGEE
jgi:hypothetical protein